MTPADPATDPVEALDTDHVREVILHDVLAVHPMVIDEAVTLLCDEVDRLASLVEKLRPYLEHKPCCTPFMGGGCECGLKNILADLLTETETM